MKEKKGLAKAVIKDVLRETLLGWTPDGITRLTDKLLFRLESIHLFEEDG